MRQREIDTVLGEFAASGAVPGVVAAATDRNGVVYRGAFGFADIGARRPMRTDSIFRVASMTKLITSIAVLQLRDAGRVDLDAPFKEYFAEFRQPPVLRSFDFESRRYRASPSSRHITLRQLLTHTSGYGYWFLNPELRALTDGEPEFFNPPFLVHEPGTRFQYGISTDVLGQLVAPQSGLPLEQYLAERIFEPLGMPSTGYSLPAETERLAAIHIPAGGGFAATPLERIADPPRGGGGLYATAEDYLAVLRMLLNDGRVGGHSLLSPDAVRALAANQIGALAAERQTTAVPSRTEDFRFMDGTQKFGLGVLIETHGQPSGRNAGSYGWGGIFNTYFWVDPLAGLAAVVCMQLSPFAAAVCLDLCAAFDTALYREIRSRR